MKVKLFTLSLLLGTALCQGAEISYSIILDETMKQKWVADVSPSAQIKSPQPLVVRDKVSGRSHAIDKKGVSIGINDYNIIDFCIDTKQEPLCREIIISDFSYEGLAMLLLGGRGERLKYAVLFECREAGQDCRYPHLVMGPNPILKLQAERIRPHYYSEEGFEAIVAGPYPPKEAEKILQRIRKIVPDAVLR